MFLVWAGKIFKGNYIMQTKMEKIVVKAIIEMLGAPKDYIDQILRDYLDKLQKDNEMKITKIEEPQEQGKLFSTFGEIEITFKKLDNLLDFCFDSMPSSVEILSPDDLKMRAEQFTVFLNDLQARLHENDLLIKEIKSRNEILDKNSINVFRNFILFTINQGIDNCADIGKTVGLTEKHLKPFLDKMMEENILTIKEGKYSVKNGQQKED